MGGLSSRHLLEIEALNSRDIDTIITTAQSFKEVNERVIKKLPTLRGRTVVNLFLEPSTRTRTSFELAAKRLSADAINMSGSALATVKGESLVDTAKTLDAMDCDLVVLRHAYAGSPHILARTMRARVINAGDGKHQHPTQTLLDLFTMRQHFGRIEGLNVGIVGDVAHSRVAGSLLPALAIMGASATVIAPPTLLPARPDVLGAHVCTDLDSILPELDVVYMLRVQQERLGRSPFPSLREYAQLFGINSQRLATLKDEAIIMHPGPVNRGVELSSAAVDTAKNLLLYQVSAGVAVRMALMYLLLGGEEDGFAA
ncbi:MAG: aspartate carbamoyltransferase catalytic subunit [Coriobacteriales bacterium]|jgi:aspartate carbamoyltransferase catalytic subunit|nr:aspartate carbamoyltransferase catalytic subunit [Coriobacteriales bacterium]